MKQTKRMIYFGITIITMLLMLFSIGLIDQKVSDVERPSKTLEMRIEKLEETIIE